MSKVLIIGATSAIAKAVARQLADEKNEFFLVARNDEQLQIVADDITVRGASNVTTHVCELQHLDSHPALIDTVYDTLGNVDIALIAHGTLPEQDVIQNNVTAVLDEININGVSVISLATLLAARLEKGHKGTLAVISSVAGDRGRQSNYVYGAAKGMVSIYMQGLRNRLNPLGIQVLTIKPGFVDTPMTASFKKGALWATPEKVAADIIRAVKRGGSELYTPFFWRYIMLVIKSIPEFIFKRLKL